MNTEEKYKLHKGFYEFEFQQKNFVISRLTTAYTVVVVIGGAGAYFLNNLNLYPITKMAVVFLLLFVPFAALLLKAFFCLTKCFFTYEYGKQKYPRVGRNYDFEEAEILSAEDEIVTRNKEILESYDLNVGISG